jgi:hypothetical protein
MGSISDIYKFREVDQKGNPLNGFGGVFIETFESYTPGSKWLESKATGDIIQVDGNTAAASYLVISKDPLAPGTESVVTAVMNFPTPLEMAMGIHLSQRTFGQEFAIEIVDTGPLISPVAERAISAISQTTTTLTIDTIAAHDLLPGMRIGIYGVTDSRLNYPALVVLTAPSANRVTVASGPNGTIPSLTVGPFASGMIYYRPALGYSANGTSMIFENGTATNASFYSRADAGDTLPGAGITGTHQSTIGSTASVQAVNAPNSYAFQPTTEYRSYLQQDRVQWSDVAVDSTGLMTNRLLRTQVVPSSEKLYKLRIRAINSKGLSVPIGQIVSIAKSGTTTATVVLHQAHGLTTGDNINLYGVRDQTNFPNLAVATVVASVVNSTTITVVIGSAVTATSYGGYVALCNGGNLMSALGAIAQVAASAVLAGGVLTITGNAAWAGLLIGDYVNVTGLRVDGTGASLDCDGAWKVRNISTTSLELLPLPGTTAPTDFASTNCGGGIIKRSDLRISYARLFAYQRQRVEMLPRPSQDASQAVPVQITGGSNVSMSATQSSRVTLGNGWYMEPDNVLFADVATAALTTTTTTATITPTPVGAAAEFNIVVTAVSGTSATLDAGIEESDDSGVNWYRIYDFPRITTTGAYRSPVLPLSGNRLRYVQTVGGTTPSFTRVLNRITHQMVSPPPYRQVIDRAVAVGTLNATTVALKSNGAKNIQLVLSMGAITTTAPALQIEGSDDNGATWYAIGAALTGVASATVQVTVNDFNADLLRARVTTAGVGATLGYALLKTYGA